MATEHREQRSSRETEQRSRSAMGGLRNATAARQKGQQGRDESSAAYMSACDARAVGGGVCGCNGAGQRAGHLERRKQQSATERPIRLLDDASLKSPCHERVKRHGAPTASSTTAATTAVTSTATAAAAAAAAAAATGGAPAGRGESPSKLLQAAELRLRDFSGVAGGHEAVGVRKVAHQRRPRRSQRRRRRPA